jgi:hypothetical protein
VTKRNGTAADIDLAPVEAQDLFRTYTDHRERLVELPQRNVLLLDASLLESDGDGEGRSGGEIDGGTRGIGKACLSAI